MNQSSPVIISHRADLDGWASAAILRKYFRLKGQEPEHYWVQYGEETQVLAPLQNLENRTIVIADFSIGDKNKDALFSSLQNWLAQNCKIYWFDNHRWDDDVLKFVKARTVYTEVVGENACSAELVYGFFVQQETGLKKLEPLAKLAHDYDTWKRKLKLSIKLSRIIHLHDYNVDFRERVVEQFSNGVYWNAYTSDIYALWSSLFYSGLSKILRTIQIQRIKGQKIAFVYNTEEKVDASEGAEEMKKRKGKLLKGVNIVVFIFPNGKIEMRRWSGRVDLSYVAKDPQLGGGGVMAAAGGLLSVLRGYDDGIIRMNRILRRRL